MEQKLEGPELYNLTKRNRSPDLFKGARMDWCAAEAKEKAKSKLSEVLGEAKKETQKIRNRGKPIAAVVSI